MQENTHITQAVTMSSKKLAHEVVKRAELRDINLHSFAGTQSFGAPPPAAIDIEVSTQGRHKTENNDEQLLFILLEFDVTGTPSDDDPSDARMQIKAAYELVYQLTSLEGLGREHFSAFSEWVSIYNAWPYLRSFVQSMSAQMGIPQLTLPIYKPKTDRSEQPPEKVNTIAPGTDKP